MGYNSPVFRLSIGVVCPKDGAYTRFDRKEEVSVHEENISAQCPPPQQGTRLPCQNEHGQRQKGVGTQKAQRPQSTVGLTNPGEKDHR